MKKIPLNRLRIEWNDARNGCGFRLSHVEEERSDPSLLRSGGACFTAWQEMDSGDLELEAWLWHTLCEALAEGADPFMVRGEVSREIETPLRFSFQA